MMFKDKDLFLLNPVPFETGDMAITITLKYSGYYIFFTVIF